MPALFQKLWSGNVPLAQTFWIYYFVVMLVLRALAGGLGVASSVVIIGWAGFMVVPIWRASDKYQGNPTFALLAKVATVVIALGVLRTIF